MERHKSRKPFKPSSQSTMDRRNMTYMGRTFSLQSNARSWMFLGLYMSVICVATLLGMMSRGRPQVVQATATTSDDNWKQGLYTNRTLNRDQDPLHVQVYSRRRGPGIREQEEEAVNMSFSASMTVTRGLWRTGKLAGEYWDDLCVEIACYKRKSAKILQDLIILTQLQSGLKKQGLLHHVSDENLSPRVRQLVAAAAYGLDDFWDSFQDVKSRNVVK